MRLIDADKLKKSMERMLCTGKEPLKERYTCDVVCCVIDEAPSVDAEPVRYAEWDNSGRYRFKNGRIAIRCTSCGCALSEYDLKKYKWNYCPVCGAKMDGGADDENT